MSHQIIFDTAADRELILADARALNDGLAQQERQAAQLMAESRSPSVVAAASSGADWFVSMAARHPEQILAEVNSIYDEWRRIKTALARLNDADAFASREDFDERVSRVSTPGALEGP